MRAAPKPAAIRVNPTVCHDWRAPGVACAVAARITGDVTYETITIENGGKVEGKLSHRRAGAIKSPPPLEVVENKSIGA